MFKTYLAISIKKVGQIQDSQRGTNPKMNPSGGVLGTLTFPPPSNLFHFHAVFGKNLAKLTDWRPLPIWEIQPSVEVAHPGHPLHLPLKALSTSNLIPIQWYKTKIIRQAK